MGLLVELRKQFFRFEQQLPRFFYGDGFLLFLVWLVDSGLVSLILLTFSEESKRIFFFWVDGFPVNIKILLQYYSMFVSLHQVLRENILVPYRAEWVSILERVNHFLYAAPRLKPELPIQFFVLLARSQVHYLFVSVALMEAIRWTFTNRVLLNCLLHSLNLVGSESETFVSSMSWVDIDWTLFKAKWICRNVHEVPSILSPPRSSRQKWVIRCL